MFSHTSLRFEKNDTHDMKKNKKKYFVFPSPHPTPSPKKQPLDNGVYCIVAARIIIVTRTNSQKTNVASKV